MALYFFIFGDELCKGPVFAAPVFKYMHAFVLQHGAGESDGDIQKRKGALAVVMLLFKWQKQAEGFIGHAVYYLGYAE